MKLKLISCEVFQPELEQAVKQGKSDLSIEFLPFGLHEKPEELRAQLQERIDAVPAGVYGAILVGYCLCSRAVVGIQARHTPLVLPKAHDCITVLLGSRQRYNEQFAREPGTYYYSPGWIAQSEAVGGDPEQMPAQRGPQERRFAEYAQKYGEDNAQYLMEIESAWTSKYSRAAFINTNVGDIPHYRDFVKKVAADNDWKYEEIPSDLGLISRFLDGRWNGDFLVVAPGQQVTARYDAEILGCKPAKRRGRGRG
jgi:hypothetical protein